MSSNPSHLRDLDLSRNEFRGSQLKFISAPLEYPQCEPETLRSDSPHTVWNITSLNVYILLCSKLSGEKAKFSLFSRLPSCRISEEGWATLASALTSNPSHLRELVLRDNYPTDNIVKQLSHMLEDPQCELERLMHVSNKVMDQCIHHFEQYWTNTCIIGGQS